MAFVFGMLVETAAIPVVVAVVVTWFTNRFSRLSGHAVTTGVAAGFVAGWYSQEFAVWIPERYLDWMPLAALFFLLLPRLVVLPATFLLVPSFASLQPPRPVAIGMVATGIYVFGLFVEKAASQVRQRLLTAVLMATGTSCSIVLVQSSSLKLAQIGGILTAALAPGAFWSGDPDRNSKGLAMLFFGLLSNLMFIGYANTYSDVPVWCFALPLAAPTLMIWNPSAGWQKKARIVAIATILLVAVVPALLAHPPWEDEL
ncbi:MAG TPA: hypothetical protein DCG12_17520 [Planctomycetaceae bacterium]|nr:hypothetical protein [Planctomycetaceae bacterium]